MRIMLQFAEGLKQFALEYASKYEKEGYEVIVSAEPTYGACDIPVNDAKVLGCKKIVHYGHVKFCNVKGVDVEYVPVYANVDVREVMKKAIQEIKGCKRVGIVTNLAHVNQINEIKKILKENKKVPITAKGSQRCDNEAQILGCDVSALNKIKKKVDCVIYFGTGTFHALAPGVMDEYDVPPMLWVDPFSREVRWINDEIMRIQKQRRVALMKAAEANVYGILVSVKVGQYALPLARALKKKIEKMGKKAIIIAGDTFDFVSLGNFRGVDAFVNTACPRIVDDQNKTNIPIVNASEFETLLKMLKK